MTLAAEEMRGNRQATLYRERHLFNRDNVSVVWSITYVHGILSS